MQFSLEKTHEHLFAISESKYAILLTYVSIDLQNIGGKNEESLLHCLEYVLYVRLRFPCFGGGGV